MNGRLTHGVPVVIIIRVHGCFLGSHQKSVDRTSSLGITQDASVIDEGLCSFVGGEMQLNKDSLDVEENSLECVEETAGLKMFRGSAPTHRGCVRT